MHNIISKPANCKWIKNRDGFTTIELISVLIILSVIITVSIKKFGFLSDNANVVALHTGVRELQSRETVAWFDQKLSGYKNDLAVYNAFDKNLGEKYSWSPGPEITGGRLHFNTVSVDLSRTPSTVDSPGIWN